MLKSIAVAAALGLLAACATAEPETAEPVVDTPVEAAQADQIEQLAAERLAREPEGALPSGLQVSILDVEEEADGLSYKVELFNAERRRGEENYVLYGQCPPAELARCADQIAAAARMLKD
ncbi:MAG TPA: hypothetical protein VD906_06730 [Caulobacteraceae bacterium]|nr:hypothetical protein [Caulobacteraceae bacterium]